MSSDNIRIPSVNSLRPQLRSALHHNSKISLEKNLHGFTRIAKLFRRIYVRLPLWSLDNGAEIAENQRLSNEDSDTYQFLLYRFFKHFSEPLKMSHNQAR